MRTALVLGIAILAVAGSAVVSAQQIQGDVRPEQGSTPSGHAPMPQRGMSDGRLGEHLSSLKEALRLSPEQEANWRAYEGALQALSNVRRERMAAGHEQRRTTNPTQRLRERAEALAEMGAALARVADAQEPLYNSLDEAQKRRFANLSPESLHSMRGSRGSEDERDRRSGRDEDVDRGGDWRDYDRRDRDYDRDRRYGRYDDGDREWRGRDYHRHGWRDWNNDGRDRDYDRGRPYGRYHEGGRSWRERDYRHYGWRDQCYDARDRGYYDRGRADDHRR
jgi:hypothetical protein